jgi:hypothetical protein
MTMSTNPATLELTREDVLDIYETELEKSYAKVKQLYHFIEMTEALTYDQATATRIRSFLIEEGIWQK